MSKVARFFCDEGGAGLAEYLLLISLIAMACLVAVAYFGGSVLALYEVILASFEGATVQ